MSHDSTVNTQDDNLQLGFAIQQTSLMFKCSQTSTCSETNHSQQHLVLKNVESKPTKMN